MMRGYFYVASNFMICGFNTQTVLQHVVDDRVTGVSILLTLVCVVNFVLGYLCLKSLTDEE